MTRHSNSRDPKTSKSTGTSCQIEIHFSTQTTNFVMKYKLFCFQISGRLINIFLLVAKFEQVSERKIKEFSD